MGERGEEKNNALAGATPRPSGRRKPGAPERAAKRRDGKRRGRLKRAAAGVAPQIAHALGGPLAGAAVNALSRALFGADDEQPVDETALADALERASPQQLIALHEADRAFRTAVLEANTEALRVAADDRANARARQQAMEDWTPCALGALIIAGFFIVLAAMVSRRLPPGAETEFSIMLGALATMTAAVVNYFFGSSAGSREKTRLLTPPTRPLERERDE